MGEEIDLILQEQIARVVSMQEEVIKFRAEQRRLMAEEIKLNWEQHRLMADKLMAETSRLNRDSLLAPVLAAVTVVGGALGLASFLASHWCPLPPH